MRSPNHVASLATLCLIAALIAGCGSDGSKSGQKQKINASKVEATISQGLSDQLKVDLEVKCPSDVERAVGSEFTCVASGGSAERLSVKAIQASSDGNVKWKVSAGATDLIEQQIAARILSERSVKVAVDCPDAVKWKKGHTYTCTATDANDEHRDILVTETNDTGQVTWKT